MQSPKFSILFIVFLLLFIVFFSLLSTNAVEGCYDSNLPIIKIINCIFNQYNLSTYQEIYPLFLHIAINISFSSSVIILGFNVLSLIASNSVQPVDILALK